jgi:DNA-binding NarL/FixJ family response regulator
MGRKCGNGSGRPKVIVADDDPCVLDQLQGLLDDDFEILKVVVDGQALIDAVAVSPPDVVVSDITMPRVDGLQAARELARRWPRLPVVILSVHDEAAYVDAAAEVGAVGYVVKRRAGSDLIPAIRSALSGQRYISPALDEQRGPDAG